MPRDGIANNDLFIHSSSSSYFKITSLQFMIPQVQKEFQGNANGFMVQKNVLRYGVGSSVIRFRYSAGAYQSRPCLRAEIYGIRVMEPKGE